MPTMPTKSPSLRRYETVRIKTTCPIQALHGTRAVVAHLLNAGRVLLLSHDHELQKKYGDLGDYFRIDGRHLENLHVPIYPPPNDRPFFYLPQLEELVDTLPARERLPLYRPCPICANGPTMKLYTKGDHWWYGHKRFSPHFSGGFRWCNGYYKWGEGPAPSHWSKEQ